MGIKEKLKSFVPPSANTFHSFVVESNAAYSQILAKSTPPGGGGGIIVWEGHEFEYNALVSQGFFDIIMDKGFKERYLKLVKGLDEESIETVNRIFSRMQCCRSRNEGIVPLDIFTPAEKDYFLFLQNEYFPSILKVSDDCYAYKQYMLPINHFEPCVFLDKHGLAKVEHLEKLAEKDIIDAGGFIGDSVLILSPLTRKKVYTFEPISDNYNLMQRTIEINEIKNAVCEKMALGSKAGTLTFNIAGSCSNQYISNGYAHENVPVIALDDYVMKNNLNVGLIKVDLEGAEQDFLKGAKKTIMSQKPVLLLSMYHNASDFLDLKGILESWDCGYKFKVHKGLDYTFYIETLLIAEVR